MSGSRLLSPNVDIEADAYTLGFLHTQGGQEFPICGDTLARTKKTAYELELAAVTTSPTNKEEEVMDNSTSTALPYPGPFTTKSHEDPAAFRAHNNLRNQWMQQFIPAILDAAPEWAEQIEGGDILDYEHDLDGMDRDSHVPLPVPLISTHVTTRNHLERHGTALIMQSVTYNPATGTLTNNGEPFIDVIVPELSRIYEGHRTPNDLEEIAAGIKVLANLARRYGVGLISNEGI